MDVLAPHCPICGKRPEQFSGPETGTYMIRCSQSDHRIEIESPSWETVLRIWEALRRGEMIEPA